MADRSAANRLADATSPYLRQHAHNPVDWYPWGQEALDKARREGKPILLSIGYSACHWCHVMAHESFEDPDTAARMNELFVNIKVDREERPDLDQIYQIAHQLLTQRPGGWPLTVFLTPDEHLPVFAGTYFPREGRYGLPSFTQVLERVATYIQQHQDDVAAHNAAVQQALAQISAAPPVAATLTREPLQAARRELADSYDPHHGGFGTAPKFPHPTHIALLLRLYARSLGEQHADREALHMACTTLRRMGLGGIYDQVGGGFSRYSVDDYWMIPHFEKMLYDNGLLLALYTDAWQATGDAFYARIARETGAWLRLEMQSPEGGYYSSLDADSQGEEGRYYIWSPGEIRALLPEEEYAVVEARYGLAEKANFEGKWHLHVHASFSELARMLSLPRDEVVRRWESARKRLYEGRCERVRPGRDEKILTSWNALAIKGMLRAGRLLEEPDLLESAERALAFIRSRMLHEGRLFASYKDGKATLPAYLDDYAYLLDACLEALGTTWQDDVLALAQQLADALLEHFEDREHGSFFFTANDHEKLIQRPRPLMDDATPSGNGVAAQALLRLGHLLGDTRYIEAAERTVKLAYNDFRRAPQAYDSLLIALDELLEPPTLVLLHGAPAELAPWRAALDRHYAPDRLVLVLPPGSSAPAVLAASTDTARPAALTCRGHTCLPPVHSLEALQEALS